MEIDDGAWFLLRRAHKIAFDAPFDAASPSDRQQAELLQRRSPLSYPDFPRTVFTTWILSFTRVKRNNLAAAELLCFLAFLTSDAIPLSLIQDAALYLPDHLRRAARNVVKLDGAISVLRSFSLIQLHEKDKMPTQRETLSIHRLVQTVLKDAMPEKIRRQWATRTVKAVYEAFSRRIYIPQAQACAVLIEEWGIASKAAANLLYQAGVHAQERLLNRSAGSPYLQALSVCERVYKSRSIPVVNCLFRIGQIYQARKKFVEAESFLQRALDIRTQLRGSAYPSVAECKFALGRLYALQGNFEQAVAIYQELVEQYPPNIAVLEASAALNVKQPTTERAAFFLLTAHATGRKPGERVTDQYRREQIAFPNQNRYFREPRPARQIPTREQLEHAARSQAQYEATDESYSGHSAGIHPEHRPYLTDERTPRTQVSASVPIVADDNELEEDEDYYVTRPHTSSRRYQSVPEVTTRQGRVNVVEHYHEQPLRAHRQQLPPPQQRYSEEDEQLPFKAQRRFHPLVWIGTFCIFLILGWFGLNAVTTWYQSIQNDWTYGKDRHFEINAVVGHGDSATNPSHFTAENNNGQIIVIELPGNNVSKAKIYQIETVPGNAGNRAGRNHPHPLFS